MTLYRIFGGRNGIDYYERSKELGFVEAETKELALEYARTLKGFEKPDNGYDADLIAQGRHPAASEGYVQQVDVFVATPETLEARVLAAEERRKLQQVREEIRERLSEIDKQLEKK